MLRSLPSGWRNVRSAAQQVSYAAGGRSSRSLTVSTPPPDSSTPLASPTPTSHTNPTGPMAVHATWTASRWGTGSPSTPSTPDAVDLDVGGIRRRYSVHRVGTHVYVDGPDGSTALAELPRFAATASGRRPARCSRPMPGVVVRVLAAGRPVTAGQPLVVLEAMKMEHDGRRAGGRQPSPSCGSRRASRSLPARSSPPWKTPRTRQTPRREKSTMARRPVRIANCSGFYGDRLAAAREMLAGPIDVLTGDYLAELTMLILWKARARTRSWATRPRSCARWKTCSAPAWTAA